MSCGITTVTSKAAPLDQVNVDTDQIIPKQFLTSVSKQGFGRHLFHDWRYLDSAGTQPNLEFVLNQPQHQGTEILLSRENFGCGSSREHAPWALADYGFKVVIATSFADIFYGNCINNQLLPVSLSKSEMDALFDAVQSAADTAITVDLVNQTVSCNGDNYSFTISPLHKETLIKGLDAIGQTLEQEAFIQAYEKKIPQWRCAPHYE
ncbi:3-isopropylmalate dehydratase small subunit [Pseudoalteromonas sp. PS5]|uniref:3-isopropylmalate dehydratase small subunit n=1 Tax=Pseudoalteromonas sp. PS5 TaxID=1437473 RepID=UPI000FFEC6B4|nr:3-isopropylmalate dehydratase small subunit [Pseudoalteromonas sp. PS5]RXF06795.1 3-isopropylmalate dehydratase small subunit [Pseudoalteromonas sp. PS5]